MTSNIDLRTILQSLADSLEDAEQLKPSAITTQILAKLGEADIRALARQALRQRVARICRSLCEADNDSPDLFDGVQARYPTARSSGEDVSYVPREAMTAGDVTWNIQRLRKEGTTKLAHAETLQRWWDATHAPPGRPARDSGNPEIDF
jgi:hypothetical protein